ncbi:RIP metalloprotease RseP [Flavobacterium branchiophilum]|uniref:Zinc metalloprotease n=1 Tax=Flavobacterium branchiophilum (strain FL-15) TaxID=1034807 RepID=G2Z536_FLABF|nr:RIP metalloprotease RseP [Flavobacterium branchiophilum]CCB70766.1 Probable M50 family membrane-associated zinc metalloprotease [Flavobacterium branchiophilum FL-15]
MIQLGQILFILSVLVILHEFGHYIAAKMFKVRVEKFYLFMDPYFSLFKKKIGETEWGIGWLPMGGYVKLSGMIDESMDMEQMKQEPQPWEFRSKPAWQRLIIMLGGIIVNILLAWLIYTVLYVSVGQKYISTEAYQKNGLTFSEVGLKAGFKNGDQIKSVDGVYQPRFNRMQIDLLLGDKIIVERQGVEKTIVLTDENKRDILSKEGADFMRFRTTSAVIDTVFSNSEAQKAGLQKNDKILALNGKTFQYFDELQHEILKIKNDSLVLKIERNKQIIDIRAKTNAKGNLGFKNHVSELESFKITKHLTIAEAFPMAVKESWEQIKYNVKQFKLIFRPKTEAYKHVKSPIGIARMLPDEWDWEFVWGFTAMFSVGLAFMNILPIPGLDGGHALFTIAEMITGKTLNEKTMGVVQTIGMVILLSLMALTFGKDIYQWIMEKFI